MTLLHAVVIAVALLRAAELLYSRRNARALLARGGVEVGASHYGLFVALHVSWLAALLVQADDAALASPALLAAFALLQAARLWVIASLGRYWTTRVITAPDAPLVARGPYRLLRHPNYLIVALEIATLPLAFGLWRTAIVFSALNGALLAWRIEVEDRALAPRRARTKHDLNA